MTVKDLKKVLEDPDIQDDMEVIVTDDCNLEAYVKYVGVEEDEFKKRKAFFMTI